VSNEILFEPLGKRQHCADSMSIMECARAAGAGIAGMCGGRGTCGKCRVRIVNGRASQSTAAERSYFSPAQLKLGWRLACQAHPESRLHVSVPAESMTASQRIQTEGQGIATRPDPIVKQYDLRLAPPSLKDVGADADRLLEALNQRHGLHCDRVDTGVLHSFSTHIRSLDWKCRVAVRLNEVVGVASRGSPCLGLAVDLGTTKVAGYLINLASGTTLSACGVMNPQMDYGEDVVSRITRVVQSEKESRHMQELAVAAINHLATDLCKKAGRGSDQIADVLVVGNTAMHHLLLGLPVAQLARSPFVPAVKYAVDVKARELGLPVAAGAYVHLFPNIAGYVGADHVAALLSTRVMRARAATLLIDIGTNTEISFVKDGEVTALSCASGPAFEGGHIRDGMRAAPGAIERVHIEDGKVEYQTIDDGPVVGICGSGLLDAAAQMYQAGVIDEGGRMQRGHRGVRSRNGQLEFVIASGSVKGGRPAVAVTQRDVRELQLAKGAIRAGIQALLEAGDCAEEQISRIIIAGAFGSYIDVSSGMSIGMLPSLPLDRFRQVGNAAGMGAKMGLISRRASSEADRIASKVKYIELAGATGFNKTFAQASYFGCYRIKDGQRKTID
jgi:uncharacterized 2Fe-2S/4Fe-4S cluster protein (DUF4445 family)